MRNKKRRLSPRMSLVSNETLQYANSSAKVPFQAIAGEERKLTFKLLNKSLQISILMLYHLFKTTAMHIFDSFLLKK